MSCRILIDCGLFETRIAAIQDDKLTDLIIEHDDAKSVIENIYLGRVTGFSDTMDGAFIDLGGNVSGLLLGRDIPSPDQSNPPVRQKLHEGEKCVVQVIKDAKDGKAAQLSAFPELGKPDLIYKPVSKGAIFSRKFKDKEVRQEIRDALGSFSGGVTLRSRAMGKTPIFLSETLASLLLDWTDIQAQVKKNQAPRLLRAGRPAELTLAAEHISDNPTLVVNDPARYKDLTTVIKREGLMQISCSLWTKSELLFDAHDIEGQIDDATAKRLPLPSGGNITIEETEALVVIDVNSGANDKTSGLKSVAFSTNEEAASLAAEQIRLRNLSGIIIIDFIHMPQKDDHRKIETILRHLTANDPSAVRVIGMTELGLMQLTRQRKRPPLSRLNASTLNCATGTVPRAIASKLSTDLQRFANSHKTRVISLAVSPDLAPLLKQSCANFENTLSVTLIWKIDLALRDFAFSLSRPSK